MCVLQVHAFSFGPSQQPPTPPSGLHNIHLGYMTQCIYLLFQICCIHSNKLPENSSTVTFVPTPHPPTPAHFCFEHINEQTANHDTFPNHTQINGYCCSDVVITHFDSCQPIMTKNPFEDSRTPPHIWEYKSHNPKLVCGKCGPSLRHLLITSD